MSMSRICYPAIPNLTLIQLIYQDSEEGQDGAFQTPMLIDQKWLYSRLKRNGWPLRNLYSQCLSLVLKKPQF